MSSSPNVIGIYRACCSVVETYHFPSVLTVRDSAELPKIKSHFPFDPKKVLLDLRNVEIVSRIDPTFSQTCKFCYCFQYDCESNIISLECGHKFCSTCVDNLLYHSELCPSRECYICNQPAFKG